MWSCCRIGTHYYQSFKCQIKSHHTSLRDHQQKFYSYCVQSNRIAASNQPLTPHKTLEKTAHELLYFSRLIYRIVRHNEIVRIHEGAFAKLNHLEEL